MARKMMTVLALVALFSTAACNSVMGPVADQNKNDGTSARRGGPKPPADTDLGKVIIAPDPGEGGGPGSGTKDGDLGTGRLGSRNRAPIHGDFDGNQGGGGENQNPGSGGPVVIHRGIEVGAPDQP